MNRPEIYVEIEDMPYDFATSGPMEDIELAHEMAIAMDHHMEQAIWARGIYKERTHEPQDPTETYRRTGERAKLFDRFIQEERTEASRLGLPEREDKESYARAENRMYISSTGVEWFAIKDKDTKRFTYGFIGFLAARAAERYERHADSAAQCVYFKQQTKDNIAKYEAVLAEGDEELYAPIPEESEEESKPLSFYHNEEWRDLVGFDNESIALAQRQEVLADIVGRKSSIYEIATVLGTEPESLKTITREEVVNVARTAKKIAEAIKSSGYHLGIL